MDHNTVWCKYVMEKLVLSVQTGFLSGQNLSLARQNNDLVTDKTFAGLQIINTKFLPDVGLLTGYSFRQGKYHTQKSNQDPFLHLLTQLLFSSHLIIIFTSPVVPVTFITQQSSVQSSLQSSIKSWLCY